MPFATATWERQEVCRFRIHRYGGSKRELLVWWGGRLAGYVVLSFRAGMSTLNVELIYIGTGTKACSGTDATIWNGNGAMIEGTVFFRTMKAAEVGTFPAHCSAIQATRTWNGTFWKSVSIMTHSHSLENKWNNGNIICILNHKHP